MFKSAKDVYDKLTKSGYIANKQIALTVYLAYKLNKPVSIQGAPGVGKSQLAKSISNILNNEDPIRLQCYDGLTADEALYSWNYQKQLLYIQSSKKDWKDMEDILYSEQFLSPRPLYKAITANKQKVLLIDELDKADEDFESFLLEFLGEQQITINETKTIKAQSTPLVFITSNDKRELSDAFKRRCLYLYIEHPDIQTEANIIHSKIPDIDNVLLTQITEFVNKVRKDKLDKVPSISESIDWARTLVQLNVFNLTEDIIKQTLNILFKTQNDIQLETRKAELYSKQLSQESKVTVTNPIDDEWDF